MKEERKRRMETRLANVQAVQERIARKLRRFGSHPHRERWEQKLEEMGLAEEAYDLELRRGALKTKRKKGDIEITVPTGGN